MSSVDVLVITALREEYAQVLAVDEGAMFGSAWILGRFRTARDAIQARLPKLDIGGEP